MDSKTVGSENNIVFYEDENNNTKVEVRLIDGDVWLNVEALSNLFNIDRSGVVRHINNIYKDEELSENSTCAKIAQVKKEGNRNVKRTYPYYNLDMIISIGFRVNSKTAIKFRTWANKLIKEYIVKGFNLNDDRFIEGNKYDQKYFDELTTIQSQKKLIHSLKLSKTKCTMQLLDILQLN